MNKQKSQSGFSHLMIITAILAVGLVGTLGFVFYQNFIQKKSATVSDATTTSNTSLSNNTNTGSANNAVSQTRTVENQYSGWSAFNDSTYNFSFKLPSGISAKESASNGSSYHMINILSSKDFYNNGTVNGEASYAYLSVGASSSYDGTLSKSTVTINSSTGSISASYYSGYDSTWKDNGYIYVFQKNGNYYDFGMINKDNEPALMSSTEFKQVVDSITF